VADASVEAAYEQSKKENTTVSLEVVKACLVLAQGKAESGQEANNVRESEQKADQYIIAAKTGGATGSASSSPSTSNSAPASASSSSTPLRVKVGAVHPDPADGLVTCPTTISFSGNIFATEGSGTVSYQWRLSNGATTDIRSITFSEPGSQTVTATWRLGSPGEVVSGWEAIEVLSPQRITSDYTTFTVTCAP
jgi:hypothetical protein